MRKKTFTIKEDKGSSKKILAEMEDEYHHIRLHLWVKTDTLRIDRVELAMSRHPEPTCLDCKENLQKLIGRNFQNRNFRMILLRTIGGERGCFHVLELLAEAHDYARPHFWGKPPDTEGNYKIPNTNEEGKVQCIAYRKQRSPVDK